MTAPSATWPIIGHASAIRALRQMIVANRYPATILITGIPGSGRMTLARTFVASALCTEATDGIACGECSQCRHIHSGNCPDVTEFTLISQERERGISKSGTLTIETARAISSASSLLPRDASRRFIIIDDADTFPVTAQQALLKTLEDVPGFLTFILVATQPSAFLETILSRCVIVPLQLVPTDKIAAALDGPDAMELARLSTGRPGWAIAAQRDPAIAEAERQRISGIERWIVAQPRERLLGAYKRGEQFQRNRAEILADLETVHIIWRDLLFDRLGATGLMIDRERPSRMLARFQLEPKSMLHAVGATERCSRDLQSNVRPRLALQFMVNQWPTL
jgi:DNA polymerase-3 subunit delta'